MPLGLDVEERMLGAHNERSAWFSWAAPAERRGELEPVMNNLGLTAPAVMLRSGMCRTEVITPTWIDAYTRPFESPSECAAACAFPRSIVNGTIEFETPEKRVVAMLRDKPAMMIYGMKDRALLAEYMVSIFEAGFPRAPIHRLSDAGHFLQEDAAEVIAHLVKAFMRSADASAR
ncbi:MAG: hypothetical protein AAF605_00140 [Myxococcota bacterium]